MHPFWGRLIVNFVLCLISFIAYSSQIFIIWPWYGSELSVELIQLLLPFNIFVGLLLWNYFLCVFVDPGRVPKGWKPDTHADGYEIKKLTGAPRFCRMCDAYKPPRSHHCRTCNRCVLRMDHHCPWINNCVGHYNYGHFIRFLFFVDIACSYHLIMVTRRVFSAMDNGYWDEPSTVELVMIILNYVACVPVLLSVGIFSIYHLYSLARNSTTIEGWEKDKRSYMVKKGAAREIKSAYDLGVRRNIRAVLGDNVLMWCCPTRPPGTGLRYDLKNSDGEMIAPPNPVEYSSSEEGRDNTQNRSPWTFEDEGLNPALRPSNTQLRDSQRRRRRSANQLPGASAVPPYHPDYEPPHNDTHSDEGSDDRYSVDNVNGYPRRLRKGSEGVEILPENREEMLQRYLRELGEEPGRYVRYIPQVDDEDSASDLDHKDQ
ncbi:hypothetical protein D9619_002607 [Psilocybe cf. subviscida]|uniref:Palmitoyltransferase PFA4 n=1 Tax=Psilocybe cf. subviscida TaxID=2480587 RepID=A0A8H5ETS8_9AGAR|nr:hypothetical protein D9619_002607 [Psilocybe cf. subviscida]